MKSYLLFDSGCSTCSALAQEIAEEVGDRLAVRSLRDSDIQALLSQANPNWHWEPCLLEVSDEKVRVYTGIAMRTRLALRLGPRRTRRVMSLVYRYAVSSRSPAPSDMDRRQFLQQSGSLLGFAALISLGWPGFPRSGQRAMQVQPHGSSFLSLGNQVDGEVYEGFLLLPEGSPIPDAVAPPPAFPPESNAIIARFDTVQDLEEAVNFQLYKPKRLPNNSRLRDISLLQYPEGKVYEIFVIYDVLDEQSGDLIVPLVTRISTNYYIPHPLFYTLENQSGGVHTVMKKVSSLPSLGIQVVTAAGVVYHWFVDGLLYTFMVEPTSSIEFANEIAASFAKG